MTKFTLGTGVASLLAGSVATCLAFSAVNGATAQSGYAQSFPAPRFPTAPVTPPVQTTEVVAVDAVDGDPASDLVASLDAEAAQANAELFGIEDDATSVAISLGQAFPGDGLYAGQARAGDVALVEIAVVEEVVFENGDHGVLVEAHVKTNLAERTFAGFVVPIEATGEWMFIAGPDLLLGMLFAEPEPVAAGDDRADCIRKAERDQKRCIRNATIYFASGIALCTGALAACEAATGGLGTPGCVPTWWVCKGAAAGNYARQLAFCKLEHRDALEDCAEDYPVRPQPRTKVR